MDERPQIKFTQLANFQPKQKEAWLTLLDPNTKYMLYGGSMGPGKSYTLRWSAVGYAMYIFTKYGITDLPIGLFSKDYPTLRDRQISKISLEFPDWLGKLGETSKWGLSFNLTPAYGNAHILLRNLDDPSKYKSTEFAAEFVEELTENDEEKFRLLKTRLRYPNLEEVKFMGATNPGGIGHGYCKRNFVDHAAMDEERERYAYVHATVYDNKYQTATYIKQLESLPEKEKKMYLYGSWDVFEGQFFSEWNEQVHVCNPFFPDSKAMIVGGMDWGRSSKPSHLTAFYCGFDIVDKVFWEDTSWNRSRTFLEVTGKEKSPKEWSDEIKTKLREFNLTLDNIQWVHADTAMFHKKEDGSISISQQFAEADPRWLSLLRESNKDRIGGWEILHKWLRIAPDGLPYWRIARNCVNTIRTLPELIHDDIRGEDLDTEGEDHPADALRYQKIHLSWIDGFAGSIITGQPTPQQRNRTTVIAGVQVPFDLTPFEKANIVGSTSVIGGD